MPLYPSCFFLYSLNHSSSFVCLTASILSFPSPYLQVWPHTGSCTVNLSWVKKGDLPCSLPVSADVKVNLGDSLNNRLQDPGTVPPPSQLHRLEEASCLQGHRRASFLAATISTANWIFIQDFFFFKARPQDYTGVKSLSYLTFVSFHGCYLH